MVSTSAAMSSMREGPAEALDVLWLFRLVDVDGDGVVAREDCLGLLQLCGLPENILEEVGTCA